MNAIRTAIVVDTPYQIMSAVSYVTNHMGKEEKADIYIDTARCRNFDMDLLFYRVKKSGLFQRVIKLNSLTSGKTGYRKIFYNCFEWLFPKAAIKKGIQSGTSMPTKLYDKVIVSGPFMLQRNFFLLNHNAGLIFIEDGSGSYFGRIGVNGLSKGGELLQKLLHRGPDYIIPDRCYLYSPQFYEGEYKNIVTKLNMARKKELDILFDSESKIYKDTRIIYLDQPKYKDETIDNADEVILGELKRVPGIVVRPHPQLVMRKYDMLRCDNERLQWEIICSKYVTNKSVLIGKYSTAQLTPKLLFDIEPIVVFTHRLYGIDNNSDIDRQVNKLRNMYRDKLKVKVCEDIRELRKLLSAYC